MTCEPFTSSPAPAADCSPISSSGTSPSPQSSATPIAAKSCESEPPRDGGPICACTNKTSGCSTHPSTPAEWIALQADSLARTLARLGEARVLPGSSQGSGLSSLASFAWYDPDTHSLRTAQCSLFGDLMSSSVTLPRWGSMRNGRLYRQPTPELRIGASAFGYWPTPVAQDDGKTPEAHMAMKARMKGGPRYTPTSLSVMVKGIERGMWPTPNVPNGGRSIKHCDDIRETTAYHKGKKVQVGLEAAVQMWATPTASAADKGGRGDLLMQVRGNPSPSNRFKLPTPTARDWRSGKASDATHARNSRPLSEQVGGSLNPTWVEWLMAWPIGWTALKRSAMGKSRSRRRSRGES